MFWTYENFPNQYARAHNANCSFCNNGKGVHRTQSSDHGQWHGPFTTLEEALAASATDVQQCAMCLGRRESHRPRAKRPSTPLTFDPAVFADSVNSFTEFRHHDARYASFDFCFNYFQGARASGTLDQLLDDDKVEMTCLQLGFYLASWGMFRGRAEIMQRSSHALKPVVETLIQADSALWTIDAPDLRSHADEVVALAQRIRESFGENASISDTLTTKILLGVMGSVPAFDQYFRKGFAVSTFSKNSVRKVGQFYEETREIVDSFEIETLDFLTGSGTGRLYPKSKIIDMGFFISGQAAN